VLVFPAALTAGECESIRSQAPSWSEAPVAVVPEPSQPVRRAMTRSVVRNAQTAWLYQRITKVFLDANEIYGFAIDDTVNDVLLVAYGEQGFFGWHTDLGSGAECTRKLSMSVLLDGPGAYAGGGLQMVSMEHPLDERRAGSAIVFPAHLAHRVIPVTQGRREVLVAWMHGPTFR
jgi:PKHD-type hydroxylase